MPKFHDAQINAMVKGPRAFRKVEFPGRPDLIVGCRVLTEAEVDGAKINAVQEVANMAKSRGWDMALLTDTDPSILERCMQRQIIFAAFFDSATVEGPTPERFFEVYPDVLSLDSITTEKLFNAYLEHQQFASPFKFLDEDGVNKLVEQLGKEPSAPVLLDQFDRNTLARLCISLASRLHGST